MRVLVLVAALATLLVPTTASAATWSHRDAEADVRALTADGPEGGTPTPRRTTSDLTSVRVVHGAEKVVTTLTVRDLRPGSKGVFLEMRTPEPGRWRVELVRLDDYRTFRLTHAGAVVDCADLKQQMSPAKDTVKIKVPRSCLGTPATVRVGAGMFVQAGDGTRADDGLLDGKLRTRLRLGPEVAAG